MKCARLLSCVLFINLPFSSFAQEYSYTHYDITDGLAGSVVYCITQDKDGFIWAGTETGVSRFDGTHFRTFTAADGLPDIEILEMFGDSKGRVWMAPFRKSVCYYYQGKIHNQQNDPMLSRIHLTENVEDFAEDSAGNILIMEKPALHWIGADGTVREIDSLGGRPIESAIAISRSDSGNFLVATAGKVFTMSDKGSALFRQFYIKTPMSTYISLNPKGMIWHTDLNSYDISAFASGKITRLNWNRKYYMHVSFSSVGDSLFFKNERTGTIGYNLNTGKYKRFLPGTEVSKTFRDATGNIWFTTMGHGIYRLNSDEFRTIRVGLPGMQEAGVYAFRRIGDELVVGDDFNTLYTFSISTEGLVRRKVPYGLFGARSRILYLDKMSSGGLFLATDGGINRTPAHSRYGEPVLMGVKAVFKTKADQYLVAAGWGACLFDARKWKITDTLWRERTTTIFSRNDTCYIGTLNGLYRLNPDRSSVYLGSTDPFFQRRISGIVESSDGTLWIASYDGGVIAYRDNRVIALIDKSNGLNSNICRTMFIAENTLWVGTDKGLNKIALDRAGYPVLHYTSKDGLGSDIINTIYVDGPVVYVGTPAGLSYFDQTKVNGMSDCRLHLLSIANSGKDRIGDSADLLIPYQDRHVRFEFAAISYRSVGDIKYRYRMLGLDTTWQETKEGFLEYPFLPSGHFVFQLQAINKFGIESRLLKMSVEVATPFWQAAWFYVLILVILVLLVGLLFNMRIKRIHRRQEEKEQVSHRLAELENTALQAQMNPHFIFNCLNSIQQYIFDHEALAANRYLTGFARLIRATLHNSSRNFISLADEVDYLSTYLSLEKLRFKEKMDYKVEIDPSIDMELFVIPPMLIQPFVENSMRHGLRHKTDGTGSILILFKRSDEKLMVIVEDNGIGRKKAAAYKTGEHIEYQSKGMSLTADRIRMMNVKYRDSIHVEVRDMEDGNGRAAGTRVTLEFPVFHSPTQKDSLFL
ncbi:MAG TPA: histidine kinase [Puia sp.]|nr:histidine kinase [Puia sp.]